MKTSLNRLPGADPDPCSLVDRALSRMERGLVGFLQVSGEKDPNIFNPNQESSDTGGY